MPEEYYSKNDMKKAKKTSRIWYLFPIIFGFFGGLLGYLLIKDDDKIMAKNLFIVGIVISVIPVFLISVGVLAYYGIFAPSAFLGPTARGFSPQLQVLPPWDIEQSGQLALNVQNRAGSTVKITKIFATGSGASGSCSLPDGGVTLETGQSKMASCTISQIAGHTGSAYTLPISLEFAVGDSAFNSSGTISGTYS
jgi:hypothetical protein